MCLKKSLAVSSSLILVEQGIDMLYLVNLSRTIRMLLKPFDSGNSGINNFKGSEGDRDQMQKSNWGVSSQL